MAAIAPLRRATLLILPVFLFLLFAAFLAGPAHAEGYGADGHYYTDAEIDYIIEVTWPDGAEESAKVIARRESNYIPMVANYYDGDAFCLFQITDIAEAGLGITEADLDTPYECSYQAARLYILSGGFGPWALTAY